MDNEKRRPILRYTLDAVVQVLEETTGNDTMRNLYGLDLFAQQQDETTTYLGYDALSVRLHLDEDGDIAATYRYGPYGEVVGAGPEGYGYTGEQWDHYTNLLYLRARYYRPDGVGFLSRDPWRGTPRQPRSLQYFGYVWNSPLRYRDPTGLQPFTGGTPGNGTIIPVYGIRLVWPVQHAPGQEPTVTQEFRVQYNGATHRMEIKHNGLDIKSSGETFYESNVQPPTGAGCWLNQLSRAVYAAESGWVVYNGGGGASPHHSWKLNKTSDGWTYVTWIFEDSYRGQANPFDSAVYRVHELTATYGWTIVDSHSITETWKFETVQQQGIRIEHLGGYETGYFHVRPANSDPLNKTPSVREPAVGSYVRQGELIGYYDMLGPTTGPHLHFQLELDGQAVNPRNFLRLAPDYSPPRVWYRY